MTGVKKFFIYWSGRHNVGLGRQCQQVCQPGSHRAHMTGALGQGVYIIANENSNDVTVACL